MKKKFTILIAAAVMLLTMMARPVTAWGQTRTEVTDVMNQEWTGVTGTTYSSVTGLEGSASDAVYTVQCAGGNSSIQLRSNNNNSGIVSTTSGGTVKKVTVTWNSNTSNGRTLNVYGKNAAYSAPSDLYGSNAGTLIGTIVCGTSTELTITDSYTHIGMRSASGAMYLTEIDVTWETGGGSGGSNPTITLSDTGTGNIGNYAVNTEISRTFTVSQSDLTEGITLTATNGGTLTPNSIEQGAGTTEVTWNFTTPETPGQFTSTITATSGETSATCTYLGYAFTPHNVNIANMEHGTVMADPTSAIESTYITLTWTPDQGYELGELTIVDANNNPVSYTDFGTYYRFQMPDSDVTVNATFVVPAETHWVLTNLADLTTSDVFVIVGNNGTNYAMTNNNGTGSAPTAVSVTVTDNEITSNVAANIQWTISGNATDGYTFYPNGSTTTWLYCTSTNNGVRVGTNDNKTFKIADGYLKHDGTSRYVGIYNSQDWRCYTSINSNIQDQTFAFYKKETGGTPTCAAPTFTPAAGTYYETQNVTITSATEGSTIYYTLDGNDPTISSNVYSEALSISETTTVKAMAVKEGYNNSTVSTALYTITLPLVATPTFTPAAGTYTETQSVTIACTTEGATIYYTIDGTEPTTSSSVYSTSLSISETTTVKAMAVKSGMSNSEIATAVYTIEQALNTMQAIFDRATEVGNTATDVNIALQNCVVSGVSTNGKNVFVTDGTKGFVIYSNTDMGFAVGDILSGTVSCKVQLYNGFAELTQLNSQTSGISVATGGEVTAANIAMADLAGVNTGALVHYENLTCSVDNSGNTPKYYLTDGTTTLQVYNSLFAFEALEDGKTYNITGIYQQYYTTKEILPRSADDIEDVTPAEPIITVANATVNVEAEGGDGTLTVTYENITDVVAEVWFCNAAGTEVATYGWITAEINNSTNNVDYLIEQNNGEARTAYFKVWAYDDGMDEVYSNLVTVTQAAPVVDYATLPFEFDGGRADIETTNGLTQEGLDSDYGSSPKLKFNTTGDWVILKINEVPGKLTFDIKNNSFSGGTFTVQTSEDGVTYTDLENYTTITGTQNEEFDNLNENVRYIKWIYTEKASGNVGLGNIKLAKPDNTPSITLSSYSVEAPCTETIGSLTVTYKNIATDLGASIYWYESDGATSATYTWIDADINSSLNVDYMIAANDGANRTAYFKVYGVDNDGNDVYSDLVTVNQAAYIPPVVLENYALFTGNLVEGDYIIYYNGKAMKNTVTSARLDYTEVTSSNNVIATDNAAIIWHIAPSGEYWTIYSADADAYAAGTGVNNKAQMLGDGTDDMALWTVSGTETFEFVNKYNSEDNKNANLRNNGTYGFACYSTSTGSALTLYKRTSVVASYDKVITGYGNNNGGYYLIASPVSVNPTEVEGMVITDPTASEYSLFDLYSFDQSSETEWYNYKASSFYIKPGKGYLYAKKNDVTLTFNGMPYVGDGTVNLNYDENAEFEGWNLIGNPYATAATIPATQSYYTLNTEGSELIAGESTTIAAMEGIFVKATAANQSVTFTPQNKGSRNEAELNARVILNLKGNNTVIDRAIIRFSEGDILPKFMLDQENTKLYIPQNNDDYAVVRSEAQGEMPVNFKAAENGTYTIDFSMDNVEFSYLHLIDNKTGMDIDLLQTSSYTFEASKIDYASRFKLVFSTNSNSYSNDDNDFAFFDANGNLLILGNEGTATLQVIDITGRTVSNETFSGNYSKAINAKAGVYMLRLIQGNDVRTQKIVVR